MRIIALYVCCTSEICAVSAVRFHDISQCCLVFEAFFFLVLWQRHIAAGRRASNQTEDLTYSAHSGDLNCHRRRQSPKTRQQQRLLIFGKSGSLCRLQAAARPQALLVESKLSTWVGRPAGRLRITIPFSSCSHDGDGRAHSHSNGISQDKTECQPPLDGHCP